MNIELEITEAIVPEIVIRYSVDGGDTLILSEDPPEIMLDEGYHQIFYTATDCQGNSASCQKDIIVSDLLPPQIICPADTQMILNSDSCLMTVVLPGPFSLSDNCGLPTAVFETNNGIPIFLTFEEDPDTGGEVAESFQLDWTGLPNSAFDTVSIVLHYTWESNPGERGFFRILGEDGTEIGMTDTVDVSCDAVHTQTIRIDPSVINPWLQDGQLTLVFDPNSDYGGIVGQPELGINPCSLPLLMGNTDSISSIVGEIRFDIQQLTYAISGATNLAPEEAFFYPGSPEVLLSAGINEVVYIASDNAGNKDSCAYQIVIADTIDPTARCRESVFFTFPTDESGFTLDPLEVNDGSSDNCSVDSLWLSPQIVTCADTGSQIQVILTVMDGSGNTSSCETTVSVLPSEVQPSFILDICDPDTLILLVELPSGSHPPYLYNWSGPSSFSSAQESPILTGVTSQNSGDYFVTITGQNGCSVMGTVNIQIEDAATPIINPSSSTVCANEELGLMATEFDDAISYEWFLETSPGVPLFTTSGPELNDTLPPGEYMLFVQVREADCVSNPSEAVSVEVIAEPEAIINEGDQELCEGDNLVLTTSQGGIGFNYEWNGPDGFFSTQQNPPARQDIKLFQAGSYTLQVSLGNCVSDIAVSEVTVNPRPIQPILTGDQTLCEGDDLIITVNNVIDGDLYRFNHPNGSVFTELSNTFTLPNVVSGATGNWTVELVKDGCPSLVSLPLFILVEEEPEISAVNTGPACTGDPIIISVDSVEGASYQWIGPGMYNSDKRENTLLEGTGIYAVTVTTQGGCLVSDNTVVDYNVKPIVTNLSNDGLGCVDGEIDVCFSYNLSPVDDGSFTYIWTLPDMSIVNDSILCIEGATEEDNGIYQLEVDAGGCVSDLVTSVLEITNFLSQPEIMGEDSICEGDSIILFTDEVGGIGITYHWQTPNGERITQVPQLVVPDVIITDQGGYTVFVRNEDCNTMESENFIITVISVPDDPGIIGDDTYCEGDTFLLSSEMRQGNLMNGPFPMVKFLKKWRL